jgi:hypothetical protein
MKPYVVKVLMPIYMTVHADTKDDAIKVAQQSVAGNRDTTLKLFNRDIDTQQWECKVVKDDDKGFAKWAETTGCTVTIGKAES